MNQVSHKILMVSASLCLALSACVKKEDTIAKITVLDQNNNRVSGATVELKGTPTPGYNSPNAVREPKTATTNEQGEATFNYNDIYQLGQCGVAVFTIKASLGGAVGDGIIKVEQEKTNEETVFI